MIQWYEQQQIWISYLLLLLMTISAKPLTDHKTNGPAKLQGDETGPDWPSSPPTNKACCKYQVLAMVLLQAVRPLEKDGHEDPSTRMVFCCGITMAMVDARIIPPNSTSGPLSLHFIHTVREDSIRPIQLSRPSIES